MVKVKLLGSLISYAQTSEIRLNTPHSMTIIDLIDRIGEDVKGQKLIKMILDPELNDPRPNTIILINDKEIGVLEGLNSTVKADDVITLLPVVHGG